MSFALFENIYGILNMNYFWIRITGMAPFAKIKLRNGKSVYVEAPKTKYLLGCGTYFYFILSVILDFESGK